MGTNAYIPLANTTLGSPAATVTFSSISQSYRDLVLVISNLSTVSAAVRMRFNNDTGINYKYNSFEANGSTVAVETSDGAFIQAGNYNSVTVPENIIWNMLEYSSTIVRKNVLGRINSTQQAVVMSTNTWYNTSAISTITLYRNGANFDTNTSFTLFGVLS